VNYKHDINVKYPSTIHYILAALIPYTEPNLKLAFKPSVFFNDLEKLDRLKNRRKAFRSAYYRSIQQKLVEIDGDGVPRLTRKGRLTIQRFKPQKLKRAQLMIVFDIPEVERRKRQHLRLLLRELAFTQVQKSVWTSVYDHREYLKAEIKDNSLEKYVEIFETQTIKL
jgi:DNA-binding transcriptional regulator PaaX